MTIREIARERRRCEVKRPRVLVRSGGDGWSPAPAATVRRYHTDAYVAFLEKIELHGKEVANEAEEEEEESKSDDPKLDFEVIDALLDALDLEE